MNYNNFFQETLLNLKNKNIYRQPKKNNGQLINFSSNDYLGLSQNQSVKNAALKAIKQYGIGAGASRYVFSNNNLCLRLEQKIAELKNCQAAMVLGSGYSANIGIVPALVNTQDLIIADKLIHSSLIDGSKLSGAKLFRFSHNDINHCQNILENQRDKYSKCLIITETVFSMNGDLGKIDDLLKLAQKYNCLLLGDDAHGLGIIKRECPNYAHYLQSGTLSKAVGGYGGYVCGSALIIDYLRNLTKPAIFSTILPPVILAANLQGIKIINNDKKLGKKALENAKYFCHIISLPDPQSAIVPIIIGDAKKTILISNKLKKEGFLISAIRPPTVESGTARLRLTFGANHKKDDIKKLASLIQQHCDLTPFQSLPTAYE